jgi:hypothetical protein
MKTKENSMICFEKLIEEILLVDDLAEELM